MNHKLNLQIMKSTKAFWFHIQMMKASFTSTLQIYFIFGRT